LRDEFPPDRFDLDRFLESGKHELSDPQTKMLINRGDTRCWGSLTTSQSATAVDTALDTLFNRLSVYGIQEYFDQSLLLICTHFGWKTPLYRPQNERKGNGLIFEERHLARIAELNALDIAVIGARRNTAQSFQARRLFRRKAPKIPVSKLGDLPPLSVHKMDVVPPSVGMAAC
jgi:hypothetical protein